MEKLKTAEEIAKDLADHPRHCELPMVQSMGKDRGAMPGQRRVSWKGRAWEVPFGEYVLGVDKYGNLNTYVIRSNRLNAHVASEEDKGADVSMAYLARLRAFKKRGVTFVDLGDDLELTAQLPANRQGKEGWYLELAHKAVALRDQSKKDLNERKRDYDQHLKNAHASADIIASAIANQVQKYRGDDSGQPKTASKHRSAPQDQG